MPKSSHILLLVVFSLGTAQAADSQALIEELRRTANSGNAEAQYKLGSISAIGGPVEKDETAAANWLRKAGLQGHPGAQSKLGTYCRYGKGMRRDLAESYAWFSLAAKQGDTRSSNALEELDDEMSAEQLANGKRRLEQLSGEIEANRHIAHARKEVGGFTAKVKVFVGTYDDFATKAGENWRILPKEEVLELNKLIAEAESLRDAEVLEDTEAKQCASALQAILSYHKAATAWSKSEGRAALSELKSSQVPLTKDRSPDLAPAWNAVDHLKSDLERRQKHALKKIGEHHNALQKNQSNRALQALKDAIVLLPDPEWQRQYQELAKDSLGL